MKCKYCKSKITDSQEVVIFINHKKDITLWHSDCFYYGGYSFINQGD